MKILHVIPTFVPAWQFGGPVHSLYGLSREQVRQGHEVSVFTTNLDWEGILEVPLDRPTIIDGVSVNYFAARRSRGYFSAPMWGAIARKIASFEIVHIHTIFNWPASMAAWWAHSRRVPFIVRPAGSLHPVTLAKDYSGRIDSIRSRAKKWIYFRTAARVELEGAAAIQYMSETERDAAAYLGLRAPAVVIPHGMTVPERGDSSMLRRRWPQLDGKKIVLFLSRLDPKKGLELLFAAAARLFRSRDDFALVVAGTGIESYRRELVASAGALGIGKATIFIGPVGPREKWDVFAGADLFVLPSYHENFGVAAAEAMAAAVPVVVTDRVDLSRQVREAGAGLVVELDSDEIARAIDLMLSDRQLRMRCGERGRAAIERHFAWSEVGRRLDHAYRDAISRSRIGDESGTREIAW